jgi:predicted DNA-binding transcriptional regulator YafY
LSATKVERLLNLSAALLAAERPLTAGEIRRRVPGYPEERTSFRRTFERDKDDLRQMGIPLRLLRVEHEGVWTEGYRILPDEYALRDPGLEPDELAALHFAVHAVRLEGVSSAEALAVLAGERFGDLDDAVDVVDDGALARVPVDERLMRLFAALVDRHPVTFTYNDLVRSVEPHRLDYQRGRWYLSGHDRSRGEARSFRVERIVGEVAVVVAETFVAPEQPHPGVVLRSWQVGPDEPVWCDVAVDADQAVSARRHLGDEAVTGTDPAGRTLFRVPVRNVEAFRGLVLTFLEHAEVLGPPDVRAGLVSWLESVVAASASAGAAAGTEPDGLRQAGTVVTSGSSGPAGSDGAAAAGGTPLDGGAGDAAAAAPDRAGRAAEGGAGRVTAGDRVRRLLSIVPWIASREGPTIGEICERFGLTPKQLLADLDVVFMVGLYPFTPDELIDVIIEDDRVFIRLADYFARPLRLTPDQALALVTAGASLAPWGRTDADSPLARGLAKVAAVLGIDAEAALDVQLGEARPELLDLLHLAIREHRRVEFDYYSYGRDTQSRRTVEPRRLHAEGGHWYLDATCLLAGGDRRFRLDRIEEAVLRDELFEPAGAGLPAPEEGVVYRPRAEDPRVVLDLAPAATWVVEHYPCESVEPIAAGGLRATLAVSATAWLERLLIRLGPDATLVRADASLPADIASRAARRVLARYGAG